MSSKLRHRCTTGLTCVAILVLVAVIVTVWVMLGQGAFRTRRPPAPQPPPKKELIEKTHLDDLDSDVEFVKPLKISPLPLHDHDIIFDKMRNNYDEPPLRHHSGHFRHKEAEVWDPHPRYVIEAFGRQLFLELEHNDGVLAPDLHITHVWNNLTHRMRQDSKMYGCYYTGKIKNDLDSDVSVSLCNGMTGYIRTSEDNYYIEPAERSGDSSSSFLHRIKKIAHNVNTSLNDVVNIDSDQCETNDDAAARQLLTELGIINDTTDVPPMNKCIDIWCTKKPTSNDNAATETLLKLRMQMNKQFTDKKAVKAKLWHDVAKKLKESGYNLGPSGGEKCRQKFANLQRTYFAYVNGTLKKTGSEKREKPAFYNLLHSILHNDRLVEDDFGSTIVSLPAGHKINKRQVMFDDVGENDTTMPRELLRTTREAAWPVNYENDRKTNEHFVKVLVVADKSMVQYHQSSEDLKHYILILMSHAALLYKDASIGNSISLSVVNIWMLNDTVFTSNNSQVMLRTFCEWQKRYVVDRKHDMALLFTRNPICKKDSLNCDTLGVAEVGTMCNPSSSCAIVRERGLSSSYTIAHELGHVLSMLHDETDSCSFFHKSPKYGNIMSRMLNNGTKPWRWSECSKHFVTEFLESSNAKCLTRQPTNNYISEEIAELLPGENYEADQQCALEFGSNYRRCPYEDQPSCQVLWCTANETLGCKSILGLLPWADGTPCGPGRWCHHGKCIPLDRQLMTPVAGGWGPWQPWSKCSRSCGGGVKQTRRHCDSPVPRNGGAYCTGRSIQYDSCNTQSCGPDVPDFREVQCSEFNGITKNLADLTNDVKWVPKYGLSKRDDLCKLFCRPKNSNAYYPLKDKVQDGTKCGLNSFDICVNGICRPGGCDNRLNSNVVLDECGVCGGDNSQCEEITGEYNFAMTGYNMVLRIPKGSSNIDIRQNANNDTNYLVLVDGETGEYVLNSKTMIAPQQKDVIFGGVIISYSGSSAAVERITTPKNHKLTKDLVLWVLTVGDAPSPDITYRYIINQESAPKFGWRLYRNKWSKCNSICSGTQYMSPVCVELATNKEQPDSYCPESEKLHQMQKRGCNSHCQLRWNDYNRGPCSVNCGKGVRTVNYRCIKIDIAKENREIVDDKHCNILPMPPRLEMCHGRCESTRWEYSDWSECSTTCGGGTQRRSAKCVDNDSRTIEETHCSGREKITEQTCNSQKCPVWKSREWTPCSVTCGRGFRTKPYYCHVDNRIYDPSACDPRLRPAEREECIERPCTGWSIGHWSDCSTTCGDGVQTRSVLCKNLDDSQVTQDSFCAEILKPNETRPCKTTECVQTLPYQRRRDPNEMSNSIPNYDGRGYRWVTGAWSQCSKSCNSGVSSRMVVCRNDLGDENDHFCDHSLTPIASIECNPHACPKWEFGGWSECDSNCEKRRQVTCRSSTGSFVEDSQCDKDAKPAVVARCKHSQCRQTEYFHSRRYRWSVGKWKRCSSTCGEGQKHRQVVCEDVKSKTTLVDQFCDNMPKPKTTAKCEKYSCPYVWITTPWGQCSASCGQGMQFRNVTCHKVYQRGIVDPVQLIFNKLDPHNYCNMYEKPQEKIFCNGGHCGDVYVWKAEAWRECSHSCGKKGRRTRQIHCINSQTKQKVEKRLCPKHSKPKRKAKCNQWRCLYKSCREIQHHTKTKANKDYLISIRNRPAMVYCYKMDTNQPEEYITLHGDSQNYAENYDKRLKNPHFCPYEGRRGSCDCLDIGPERSGFTTFWKVRLNITSLRIIGDDFTFSRQNGGMKVPYGTAGDCYSAQKGCAQARFSIDLSKTSFKLAENVRWRSIGKYASHRIDRFERRVVGLCGGYCGNCVTDASIGLQVEIT